VEIPRAIRIVFREKLLVTGDAVRVGRFSWDQSRHGLVVRGSARPAGMLIPLFLKGPPTQAALYASRISSGMGIDPICTSGFASFGAGSALAISVGAHTLGHFLVTGLLALLVYEKLAVGFLRNAWFNLDLLWMMALVGTGIFILFM